MKRLLMLIFALQIVALQQVAAQSWLDALKGVASSVIDDVTGGKLTEKALIGTWNYSQPGVHLSSKDALSDLAAAAATSTIQSKMKPYYEKVGIKPGACKFTFGDDGSFSVTIGQKNIAGTYTFNAETKALALKLNSGFSVTAYAYMNGQNLQLVFPMDNLLKVMTSLGSLSDTLAGITSLLNKYDSLKIGFEFSK